MFTTVCDAGYKTAEENEENIIKLNVSPNRQNMK